ncbi:MAG: lipoprotein-releasing system ATP-binding protein LolD [Nanoarchaeota archaeon]|nr:lipoprotein-releasing system ATP-binding protein LolD [Nanoarchaeota archaeon]|tara:strand:- start:2427 stop:3104 length:678 start_codon:yes stop_codon:yes gene_type:complete
MKTIIKLQDVWKTYHMDEVDVTALAGINVEIRGGEFVAVVGPSGSGKSTSMNMIGCLDIPTKGKVFLEGKDISRMSESGLAQIRGRKIGFVFQTFNLINTLTALDNVMLPMTFQNMSRGKRLKIAKSLLTKVGLGERVDHLPGELSGGERQRVAIARALSNNPEVVLADEPTGNLDSKTGKEIMDVLCNLNKKEKKTIVMVTHDNSLTKYAQRVIRIKDGKNVGG